MRHKKAFIVITVLLALPLLLSACAQTAETPGGPPAAVAPTRTREQNIELGRQHKTAEDLFKALREEAKGGTETRVEPHAGLERNLLASFGQGLQFRCRSTQGRQPSSAKLTPEYQEKLVKRIADLKRGIEWDPISTCAPPGVPRWLTEPFLREFIVTPNQTWLINEMVNDIRRVYTDGRDHIPEEDRCPLLTAIPSASGTDHGWSFTPIS